MYVSFDPFCGGGSVPFEAQSLGIKAYASDLNPTLRNYNCNRLIEIPYLIYPEIRDQLNKSPIGLANDVKNDMGNY